MSTSELSVGIDKIKTSLCNNMNIDRVALHCHITKRLSF